MTKNLKIFVKFLETKQGPRSFTKHHTTNIQVQTETQQQQAGPRRAASIRGGSGLARPRAKPAKVETQSCAPPPSCLVQLLPFFVLVARPHPRTLFCSTPIPHRRPQEDPSPPAQRSRIKKTSEVGVATTRCRGGCSSGHGVAARHGT